MHPTFCSLQSGWNLVFWCLTFKVHPTFCNSIFRVHPTFWSLKFVVHPIFCSIQDAPCIQFYNIESAPLICLFRVLRALSTLYMDMYSDTRGVHVHPVHPDWIRPWHDWREMGKLAGDENRFPPKSFWSGLATSWFYSIFQYVKTRSSFYVKITEMTMSRCHI